MSLLFLSCLQHFILDCVHYFFVSFSLPFLSWRWQCYDVADVDGRLTMMMMLVSWWITTSRRRGPKFVRWSSCWRTATLRSRTWRPRRPNEPERRGWRSSPSVLANLYRLKNFTGSPATTGQFGWRTFFPAEDHLEMYNIIRGPCPPFTSYDIVTIHKL